MGARGRGCHGEADGAEWLRRGLVSPGCGGSALVGRERGGVDRQRGERWSTTVGERRLHRGAGVVKAGRPGLGGDGSERGGTGVRGTAPLGVGSG